jgi:hypothetical protein
VAEKQRGETTDESPVGKTFQLGFLYLLIEPKNENRFVVMHRLISIFIFCRFKAVYKAACASFFENQQVSGLPKNIFLFTRVNRLPSPPLFRSAVLCARESVCAQR